MKALSRSPAVSAAALSVGLALLAAGSASATSFSQTNLVSDLDSSGLQSLGFAPAAYQDPSLVNPWGMDHTATSGWLLVNAGNPGSASGVAAGGFYTGTGMKLNSVTIPQTAVGPMGAGAPTGATGVVYNPGTGQFVIADLDGHISTLDFGAPSSVQRITGPTPAMGPPHSVYTGVTIGQIGGQTYIYAANNGTGAVDVYGPNFQPATLAPGAFAAPAAAAGLAAFNVRNLGGEIWVTYGTPGPASGDAPLGSGLVAEFTPQGQLITSFGDPLHMSSPWGLAIAPSDFGSFAGDLLVGNFHDDPGTLQEAIINAYDPITGAYKGTLDGAGGKPILLPGLWQIEVGNDAGAGSSGNLYFAAGIGEEAHGLFGDLSANVPEPATWTMMILGAGAVGLALRRGRRRLVGACG